MKTDQISPKTLHAAPKKWVGRADFGEILYKESEPRNPQKSENPLQAIGTPEAPEIKGPYMYMFYVGFN